MSTKHFLDKTGTLYLLVKLKAFLFPQIFTYGICNTKNYEVDKIVVLNGFMLKKGARIYVRFSDSSTEFPLSGYISLNVNNTGLKTVYCSDTNTICDYSFASNFCNNKVHTFIYDGTHWIWDKKYETDALITSKEFQDLK